MQHPEILKQKIIEQAQVALKELLQRNMQDLTKFYEDWLLNKPEPKYTKKGKLTSEPAFVVPLSMTWKPRGGAISVGMKTRYGLLRNDKVDGYTADSSPDLFDKQKPEGKGKKEPAKKTTGKKGKKND